MTKTTHQPAPQSHSDEPAPHQPAARHLTCDVLIVGAGPAGIQAAIEAAHSGASVLLLDENATPGGQIWRGATANTPASKSTSTHQSENPANSHAAHRLRRLATYIAPAITPGKILHLPQTRVLDATPTQLLAWQDEPATPTAPTAASHSAPQSAPTPGPIQIAFTACVLATGARERFLPFPGWTLPGVYGAGGLQALARGGFPVRGLRVAVAGSGPLLLAVAAHLQHAGARLVGVFEQAPLRQLLPFLPHLLPDPGRLLQAAGYVWTTRRSRLQTGCWPVEAHGTHQLEAVTFTNGRRRWTLPCDALACGFHLVPNTELAQLLGCALTTAPDAPGCIATTPWGATTVPGIFAAGEPCGIAGLASAEVQGTLAGASAAAHCFTPVLMPGQSPAIDRRLARLLAQRHAFQPSTHALHHAFALRSELRTLSAPHTIVCRCEDVPWSALQPHHSWREAKLQTRCGMGPCQGRICGPAVQTLFNWTPDSIRPPLAPVPLAALLGSNVLIHPHTQETHS